MSLHDTIVNSTRKVPRDFRIVEIQPVIHQIVKMQIYVGKASHLGEYDKEERKRWLLEAIQSIEEIKYVMRALRDNRIITISAMGAISEQVEKTLRQLVGWAKSAGADLTWYHPVDITDNVKKNKQQAGVQREASR